MTIRTSILACSILAAAGAPATAQCASQAAAATEARTVLASHVTSAPNIVETAAQAGSFNTLIAAAKAAGLVGALTGDGPLTVFAPTDDAFAKLPAGTVEKLLKPEIAAQLAAILKFHVVPGTLSARDVTRQDGTVSLNGQRLDFSSRGGTVRIDGSKVIKADIECSNGVIHVIDTVMLPASDNIVVTASKAGSFGTLLAAAKAAGLAELLASEGPFTVFAPTDEAFQNLPAGTVESLLKPENRQALAAILKYHVVPGRVYADKAIAAGRAKSALGQDVIFTVSDGGLKIDGASIIATDIDASNGVIHVIDTVILPE